MINKSLQMKKSVFAFYFSWFTTGPFLFVNQMNS